ncbi:hypothetical protein EZ428_18630 [Pedobacter frigiditerrae]|uniref:Uncharacterized protein n=1 Tax=Pedobacter frigiditerrae TaxID=2530452 RepID=A0A4R0MRJ2_9SPHI|nr:hypothetical protein [Pedobacter frigiditerrae]TCC88654.1 hypothetical protein EZ428_18630 [Pedobacter frigiditerrae]
MSVKTKQAITKCLNKIADDTFDEETLRSLLIISREYIKSNGLIKELAHFVAHSDRNQGIFHKQVNNRYAKQKLIDDQLNGAETKELMEKIKTEDDLSDFLLGGISIYRIDSKLFNILYSDGLEDIPEAHLLKHTNFTKAEVKELFARHYHKEEGFHCLNTTQTRLQHKKISELENISDKDREKIDEYRSNSEILITKIELKIDQIQKVIRGAIYYTSVFDLETFNNEIATTLTVVIKSFSIDQKYMQAIMEHSQDILLCIMSLLHDSKFILYDKKEARNFLGFYLHPPDSNNGENMDNRSIYEDGVLALYTCGAGSITFPLYVSDLLVKDYISADEFNKFAELKSFSESPWITAERIDYKLRLVN